MRGARRCLDHYYALLPHHLPLLTGPSEASASSPKPSGAIVALATPSPSARMRGVVTSPVVTPAQSHAMPIAVSEGVCMMVS